MIDQTRKIQITLAAIFGLLLFSCKGKNIQEAHGVKLADPNATTETVALFKNLKIISEEKIIFGHQHTTAYGVKWKDDSLRSDVKDVTGSFPGLYGWDFAEITNGYGKDEGEKVKKLATEAYERGGINIFAWHYNNPVTNKNFYDTTVAVKHILPGGSHHDVFKSSLDLIAEFCQNLKDSNGNLIPIIFRPFHEFDGSWFWWGKNFCSKEEFIKLFRFTVEYLRDEKSVHNLLYSFSPDRMFYNKADYLDRYPGDNYVDILGMDNYYDFNPNGDGLEWISKKLKILTSIASEKNKISAFTETGLEAIPDSVWWTKSLLKVIDKDSINIAFVMVWRNANESHHYAPYPGHISAEDFIKFREYQKILFQDDFKNIYSL